VEVEFDDGEGGSDWVDGIIDDYDSETDTYEFVMDTAAGQEEISDDEATTQVTRQRNALLG
jgi:hypothetical protein